MVKLVEKIIHTNGRWKIMKAEIVSLISLKQEGSYWDFKKEWHHQNEDLLHDIICYANNLVNRDCYIIIGVDEENDYSVVDVVNDPNRKNTQNIVDFLKDKKFVGGIRPIVLVKSLEIENATIDIIIVKNSNNTPYFLTEKYRGVFSNNIYTRVMDTNTPKNNSADINNVEYLWKKRFHLLDTPLERVHHFLKDSDGWESSPLDYDNMKYYRKHPEYRIVSEKDDSRDGYEFYLFSQIDSHPHWYVTTLYYHQTPLETFLEIAMDGGRWSAIAPQRSVISDRGDFSFTPKPYYAYYIKDSLRYTLHDFLDGKNDSPEAYRQYMNWILVFENEDERVGFEKYVLKNICLYKKILAEQKSHRLPNLPEYNMAQFEYDIKASKSLQIMLNEYRNAKQHTYAR